MDARADLDQFCRKHGVLALYLFGSRADDGLRCLAGEEVAREGSDLDIGVVFLDPAVVPFRMARLQVALEEVFAPLRVDLVPLQRVDAIFQFRAIDGHRIAETDSTRGSCYELGVMRRAAELLPIQRQIERDRFGVSTT